MKRFIAGLGSLLAIAILVIGIPAALVLFAGNPIPSWDELTRALTMPDYGGEFLIGSLLPIVAWLAWGSFLVSFLIEVPAQLRRVPAPRLPGFGLQQRGAAVLIGAVLVMFAGAGSLAQVAPATADTYAPAFSHSASITSEANIAHEVEAIAVEAANVSPAAEAPTYTVQDGDSLWAIAEQTLGQGERWAEIAELNYDVQQADGHALNTQHWLNAGWVLTLPSDAAAPAVEAVGVTTVVEHERVIVSGDTLYDIAQEELGDGNRYTEIVDATAGKVQPDGAVLTDPGLIHPGWTVDVPHVVAAAAPAAETTPLVDLPVESPATAEQPALIEQPASVEQPASETVEPAPSAGLGFETAAPADAPVANESAAPAASIVVADAADDDWIDEIFSIRTAGGIGAIAAAGLLSVLGWRRLRQRRERKPGQRISMPSGAASAIELELRAVENPMGMEDVDHALRHLAAWAQDTGSTLPPVYAIRLAETEIAVYLDEATDLPDPFVAVTDDKMAWTIDPEQLPALDRIPSAPYPALVTIGQDQGNAHVLVDLEHIGALNLSGDPAASEGALTAIAVELATSQWAEDLQITLVGVAPGLPRALDTGRVRHVDDVYTLLRNLRGQAAATKQALEELGVSSIEEARSKGAEAEAWTPEIVVLGALPTDGQLAELAELVTHVPRVGIAAVAAGHLAGEWTLHLDNDQEAQLSIPAAGATLPIVPQIVNQADCAKILELLSTAETVAVDGPTQLEVDELSIDEIVPAESDLAEAAASALENHDGDDDEWKGILHSFLPARGVSAQAPAVDVLGEPEPIAEPTVYEQASTPVVQLHSAPHIQLLGTVTLVGARGDEPRTPKTAEVNRSAVARATELIAFLTLQPGANHVEVHDALWPGRDASGSNAQQSRNGLTSKARKWLGNAKTGEPYLPPVGTAGYRLHPDVRSDWDVFVELIGDDVTQTPTKSLVEALKLVKGQPVSGVKEKYYVWAERIRQEIIAAIGDAAHELATRALRHGDVVNSRLASAVGRQVDPINEIYWRDALRAEHQAGDMAGVDRVVSQLEQHLESFEDGYEAEDETQQLIDDIRGRGGRAIAS